jgi:hypothetical protein
MLLLIEMSPLPLQEILIAAWLFSHRQCSDPSAITEKIPCISVGMVRSLPASHAPFIEICPLSQANVNAQINLYAPIASNLAIACRGCRLLAGI